VSLYFKIGCPFPPKTGPSHGGIWIPIRRFLGFTQVLNPNGIWIGSAVIAGLTSVTQTDRQTDHATRSVITGRIYERYRMSHVTSDHAHLRAVCHPEADNCYSLIYLCTKYDDASFSRSRDMMGPKVENRSYNRDHAPFTGDLSRKAGICYGHRMCQLRSIYLHPL